MESWTYPFVDQASMYGSICTQLWCGLLDSWGALSLQIAIPTPK